MYGGRAIDRQFLVKSARNNLTVTKTCKYKALGRLYTLVKFHSSYAYSATKNLTSILLFSNHLTISAWTPSIHSTFSLGQYAINLLNIHDIINIGKKFVSAGNGNITKDYYVHAKHIVLNKQNKKIHCTQTKFRTAHCYIISSPGLEHDKIIVTL